MLDNSSKVIYIGKAKNLKNRLSSYFSGQKDPKTQIMLTHVSDIQITITRTEVEALLLEYQLIRQLKPRYNIIFRDDKSYPYINITTQDQFPQLTFYRGSAQGPGDYYGPYPSTRAVRESLDLLQRTFQLRSCDLTYFKSRTRPCLQYQIKRCTAPCVGLIDEQSYARDVHSVELFLAGKTNIVIEQLLEKMDTAAAQQNYEQAARLRDQIISMRAIQKQQIISDPAATRNIDVLGVTLSSRQACVHILSIRDGRMLGSRQYFPVTELSMHNDPAIILENFLLQHYIDLPAGNLLPDEIIIPFAIDNQVIIADALKLKITHSVRGDRTRWLQMAQDSATEALRARLAIDAQIEHQLLELSRVLGFTDMIKRIECFDVSHTQGVATVASCVVFDSTGPVKADYRRYKIRAATGGDDYAALEEALQRHFLKLQENGDEVPDLLLIDGGKGQLSRAEKVCADLLISGIKILGIAKGPERKPGLEKLFLAPKAQEVFLAADNKALHLLQRVRDEAHRFAITGHRKQRARAQLHSVLENIPGIGAARRRELLRHFGGLAEVQCANVEELAAVPGVSVVLAKRIYDALNSRTE